MLVNCLLNFLKFRLKIGMLVAIATLILSGVVARAQTEKPTVQPPSPPVHIIESGDNLTYIAEQYGVTIEALRVVNHLRNADVLKVGEELIIPGGEGEVVAAVHKVQIGDSLASIAHGYNTSIEAVMEANLLINRDYVPAAGQVLSVISRTGSEQPYPVQGTPYFVEEGETILEIAVRHDLPVSQLAQANDLAYPVRLFPGQRLRIPGTETYQDLPGKWLKVNIRPQTVSQGDTVSVYVENMLEGHPAGQFAGQELHFIPHKEGYVALVGIDAFTEPGSDMIELSGSGEKPWSNFAQKFPISSSNYISQVITIPEELNDLLDPELRQDEDAFLHTIYTNFSEEPRWEGLFQVPVTDTVVTAPYGGGRSYNEGEIVIYHTGTDFDGAIGTPILAAADGTVVFSETLELRGQTVIIDHGMGVMTGYVHLSEIFVDVGVDVTVGQPIGLGGSTGLSTGPHLHWEVRIMDVPVDGIRWTEELFP
jgi:murein DD-endopeptidase MepM/ murein hydrolase activator NlpD